MVDRGSNPKAKALVIKKIVTAQQQKILLFVARCTVEWSVSVVLFVERTHYE